MEKQPIYLFDHFQLDPAQKILLRDGQRVPLDLKTFLILLTLVEAAGQVVSKHELMAKVWPDTFVEENNLTKNISRLRRALDHGDESAEFIETIPKVGYRFSAVISLARVENGSAKKIREEDGKRADDDLRPRAVGRSVRRLWLGGLAVVLCVGAALILWKWVRPQPTALTAANEFAPVRLTHHIARDLYPVYAPDGKRIAFNSNRDGLPAIYEMNPDGSDVRKISNDSLDCFVPSWSADGTLLHFLAKDSSGKDAIYEADSGSGGFIRLSLSYGTFSPDGKKILMTRSLAADSPMGSTEIFVANADGGNEVRLTNNDRLDTDPAWSLDGRRIAFTCFSDGFVEGKQNNPEICVMNADGSNSIRLTNHPAWDNAPSWSPDGTRIAFHSARNCKSDTMAIHVMNADGSNAMQLTECQNFVSLGGWSPDGKKLVYASDRDGNFELYSINADPSHQTNLTHHLAEDTEPVWSPDGRQIAFVSNRDGKGSVFVMDADGNNQRKLVDNTQSRLSWSPDGRRISFDADWAGNWDIYVANADGSGITQLTRNPAYENLPVWSPDGKKILCHVNRDNLVQLYVMNADGSGVTRISNSSEHEWQHDWSPDGKQIVFTRSRNRTVQRDIWMMNADGGNPHLIAFAPGNDEFLFPRFSPDGQRIAFQRRVASPLQSDVWVMNADGSGQMRLTDLSGGVPAWSPDGKKIVFQSGKRTGNAEIYVMDVVGR